MAISLRSALVATLLLACVIQPLFARTLSIAPTADTYFEAYGSEKKNFGSEPVLRMDQWDGRQVFLRFPLTALDAKKRIVRATVRLYIVEIGFNEQGEFPELKTCVGLYDVATPWTENGLTYDSPDGKKSWNQGPGIPGPKYTDVGPLPKPDIGVNLRLPTVALEPAHAVSGTWLELDVTEFIRDRIRAKEGEVNLVLRSSTLGRNFTFHSREADKVNERPQLAVELNEEVLDFQLANVFKTDWKFGEPVSIDLKSSTSSNSHFVSASWGVAQIPLAAHPDSVTLKRSYEGATLITGVPGKYRIQLATSAKDGTAANSTSEVLTREYSSAYLLSMPPHPRLYVTAQSLRRIRETAQGTQSLSKVFLAWVKQGSRGLAEGRFHDMQSHEGCENNSLAWLITGEREFLSNSVAYAEQMLKKPMREHFEDVHAATFLGASWVHAMALHYDWCYDQLTADHRQAVIAWLKEAARWGWARSGAPIAHNDGGARQCLLGSAALALLGDDPEAEELYRLSHENFEQNLLPWLNDGGQGGRSGDGGEYEGLHGFYIVKYAWMAQTATGEDVFSESSFFFNRLRHILFGWYPRRLVEKSGAFSMRQYYSPSGDPIRMGYVGDTQPYQSSAALCARYRETPVAQAVRWLAGEWPRQWMQYTLRWAVLGEWDRIPAREPIEAPPGGESLLTSNDKKLDSPVALAYLDRGCNTIYTRSDWSDDATWVLFENAPFVSAHDSLDSGTFEIFKGDILAARTGNLDHANVGAAHTMNYLHRTIAGNCLLVEDPAEKWKGFLGGAEGGQDEGGERTNFPLSSSADADTYRIYRDIFRRGQITRFRRTKDFTYALADLTPAYNNPRFHGGKLNQPKVDYVTRELLYLRGLDALVVFDHVNSSKPEFKKRWVLHSLGDLDVLDGTPKEISDGQTQYDGATRAVIRYGWPKPVPSFARCLSITLQPEHAQITKIGGRTELAAGQTETFPGDQWHGQHQHHHIKDFWVNGTNYPPGNPPETRWFGEPTSPDFVNGTPDESGGRGKWRIEVSPQELAMKDVFFHVLCPRLGREGAFPIVSKLSSINVLDGSTSQPFDGALIRAGSDQAVVFFCRSDTSESVFYAGFPPAPKTLLVVADLAPGTYSVTLANKPAPDLLVGADGVATIPEALFPVKLKHQ
jgi:hypothetical protein